MSIFFEKYHGTGNDFIIIDNRKSGLVLNHLQIKLLCDRRLGIGADGLMLLEPSEKANFLMRYYNSDGYEGSMCGNGGRCMAAFAFSVKACGPVMEFLASDGVHSAELLQINNNVYDVKLKMKDVNKIERLGEHFFMNTGSPHLIVFTDDPENTNVEDEGKKWRNNSGFAPGGTNVNFVRIAAKRLYVRTYERGVEAETLSCGTGVTAAAIAAAEISEKNSFDIDTRGGSLYVSFDKPKKGIYRNIWLRGPATYVFSGETEDI